MGDGGWGEDSLGSSLPAQGRRALVWAWCGLCACVDVSTVVPTTVQKDMQARNAASDPGIVGKATKTILAAFKKTRQDSWGVDQKVRLHF